MVSSSTKLVAVTSFNKKGYDEYGKHMVETFDKFWPEDMQLLVMYQEVPAIDMIGSTRIKWINLDSDQYLNAFKKRYKNFIEAGGIFPQKTPSGIKFTYDYRYDALRFCHKVFAILSACRIAEADKTEMLLWLDGDTVTKCDVTYDMLWPLLPGKTELLTYLGRKNDTSEAGFLGMNVGLKAFFVFKTALYKYWHDGFVFGEDEWHDSFIFDVIRGEMEPRLFRSISGDGEETVHPFVNSPLGKFMDHLKGPVRKATGTSVGTEKHNPDFSSIKAPTGGRYAQLEKLIEIVKPKTIIEIGTWNGYRATQLAYEALKYNDSVHYTGYDLFETATPATDKEEKNVKPHFALEAVNRFLEVFASSVPGRFTFELVKGNTRDTLKKTTADFVFIDGGHSVSTIHSDYAAVKDSSFVVFDDWYSGGIDTTKYGCNQITQNIPDCLLLPQADNVQGGGTVRLVVVTSIDRLRIEIKKEFYKYEAMKM